MRYWLLSVALVFLCGCATRLDTRREVRYDPLGGHRFNPHTVEADNSNELFVVLCLSGGGTRAAAMSYGVMEELAQVRVPRATQAGRVRLLDEVDVISSVSGGSFVAGYYGLYGDRLFQDFRSRFLYWDVEDHLIRTGLSPINLARISSSTFDRVDLAAELYDKLLFDQRAYACLRRRAERPFVIVNAANLSTGVVFPFTQDAFDFLGSDLDCFPVSRAVAASSAVPAALSPITLKNHRAPSGFSLPVWALEGLSSTNRFHARAAKALVPYHTCKAKHPFMHLMDGGIADNTGLQVFMDEYHWGFIRQLLPDAPGGACAPPVRTLLVLLVNAQMLSDQAIDCEEASPGLVTAAMRSIEGAVANTTLTTIQRMDDLVRDHRQGPAPLFNFHFVEVNLFETVDPCLRNRLVRIETGLTLPRADVDAVITAGRELLRSDPQFQAFLREYTGSAGMATQPTAPSDDR